MPLYLVRHAPVLVTGTCYGQIDVPTAVGPKESISRVQAQLPPQFSADRVWSSPLARCAGLAHAYESPASIEPRLMEANFGLWEGLTWDEIHNRFPMEMDEWGANWINHAPPMGESAHDVQDRVQHWIGSLKPGTHLAFTHAGVIRATRVILKGQSWEKAMEEAVPYLGVERFSLPTDP